MNAGESIRQLLVDDHPVVRDGLHRIQELEPRVQIVGEASTKGLAIEAAGRLRPAA